MTSSSVEKFGHACGSFIIVIRSLQSVPKLWQVECWIMLSIAHFNASSSECNDVSSLLKFCVPISWIFPVLSFQTHPMPLNWSMDHYKKMLYCNRKIATSIFVNNLLCLLQYFCNNKYLLQFYYKFIVK